MSNLNHCESTWPEQNAVDAWLAKYGINVTPDAARELKEAVTEYRLTVQEALEDKRRLTRELDVALNGDGAAPQASLCDIVGQVKDKRWKLVRAE